METQTRSTSTGEFTGAFRDLFDPRDWRFVLSLFITAFCGVSKLYIRHPSEYLQARNMQEMLARLSRDVSERLALQWESPYRAALENIRDHINESRDLCRFVKETEWRDPKTTSVTTGYASNLPTAAQLGYLRSHGCVIRPKTKAEASHLIGKVKRKAHGQASVKPRSSNTGSLYA